MPETESKDNKLWDKKTRQAGRLPSFFCIITFYFTILFLAYTIMYEIIQPGRMYYTSYILTCQFLNQSLPM